MPPIRKRHWCFTLNNYTDHDYEGLCSPLPNIDYACVGREVGESGTPHLQGFLSFHHPRQLSGVRTAFFDGRGHWEPARSPYDAAMYCKKDGDFIEWGNPPSESPAGGKRSDLTRFQEAVKGGCTDLKRLREDFPDVCARYARYVSDYVRDQTVVRPPPTHVLRPWQSSLLERLRVEPDSRTINFVVDLQGNSGKSWFSDYYRYLFPETTQILNPGKKADMAFALDPNIRVLFVDAPRSKQGEFIQYDLLEDVKNCRVFSGKYESGMKYFGMVHVVVMMNEEPDMDKLSPDRYHIIRVADF